MLAHSSAIVGGSATTVRDVTVYRLFV